MKGFVALLSILISSSAIAQLREFDASRIQDPGTHIVQASVEFPDHAIVLVYSTFDNLTFRSSMSAIGKVTYNAGSSRYEVLIQPVKQILFVAAPGFIETELGTVSPTAKQAIYYKVDERIQNIPSGKGTIEIQSDPSSATIFINDFETAYKTPSSHEINAGTYSISLRKPTYLNFDSVVRVKPGERIAFHANLTPAWAEVSITSKPADATISIGNRTAVGVMNLQGSQNGLTPGTYTLRVERASTARILRP
ncbi:MAG: PEGA domain-containing protein [Bacteroidota bacterium]